MVSPRIPFRRALGVAAAVLFAGLPISHVFGQIQTADSLLVDLDAATFNTGDSTWQNTGALLGNFSVNGTPTRQSISGAPAIFFDASDFFVGPATNALLHDANRPYTIEAWANQGYIRGEESLVSWSSRGGPDGANVSLNYGNDNRWGAMGHWGNGDMGFGPTDGVDGSSLPSAGSWHHIVYTYDGAGTQRIYVDGVNTNTETGFNFDAKDNLSINIGAQRNGDNNSANIEGANRLEGELSKVRVHAGALNAGQVLSNYNFEKSKFQLTLRPLTRGPLHRYTFNNLSGATDGTVVPDVGTAANANATIRGAGAVLTGDNKGLDLPGGTSATQAYVDLPNGIASGKFNGGNPYESATYETWVTIQSNQNWSRIMDFGTGNEGEKTAPGGGQNGTDYIFLSANTGGDPNIRLDRAATVGGGGRTTEGNNSLNQVLHMVMTYDAPNHEWKWYRNGTLMEGFDSTAGPATLDDVNNWLGRSQWNGDANLDGVFDEFRIYDFALSQEEVAGNFAQGADVVNVPEPATLGVLAAGFAVLGLGRWRRRS
ncbi:MAG: LamG-like jellyroll fold domain-containing protein [Verrucomicrobiota bacterium]